MGQDEQKKAILGTRETEANKPGLVSLSIPCLDSKTDSKSSEKLHYKTEQSEQ
jgi:hypothetical protein